MYSYETREWHKGSQTGFVMSLLQLCRLASLDPAYVGVWTVTASGVQVSIDDAGSFYVLPSKGNQS